MVAGPRHGSAAPAVHGQRRGWDRVSDGFGVQAVVQRGVSAGRARPTRPQVPKVNMGASQLGWGKVPAGQEWGLSPAALSPPVPSQGSTSTPCHERQAVSALWRWGVPAISPVCWDGGAAVTPIHSCRRDLGPQDRWRPRAPKQDKRFKLIEMPA